VIVLDAISMRTPGDRISHSLQEKLPHIPLIHLRPETAEEPDSEADVVLMPSFTARKLVNSIERMLTINQSDVTGDEMIVCDCFSMSPGRRVLLVNGQEKSLTPKQSALVEIFFRNPGVTLARETLMKQVWDTNYMGDTRTLDVHIRWIRRAIESDPSQPLYLKTVRGVGYRLDVPDEPEPIPQPETVLAVP
jgi:DNA-binding response OmpR family regulator